MASSTSVLIVAFVALVASVGGCARQSSAFPLDMRTVRELSRANTAQMSFEESGGDIFVTIVDKSGDGHIHRLSLDGTTRQQALVLLRQKQAEFGAQPNRSE
jgi:hypothetical protein